jgi:hypothetical protein
VPETATAPIATPSGHTATPCQHCRVATAKHTLPGSATAKHTHCHPATAKHTLPGCHCQAHTLPGCHCQAESKTAIYHQKTAISDQNTTISYQKRLKKATFPIKKAVTHCISASNECPKQPLPPLPPQVTTLPHRVSTAEWPLPSTHCRTARPRRVRRRVGVCRTSVAGLWRKKTRKMV